MMKTSQNKQQVCLQLPVEVVKKARETARRTQRTDGLKQTTSATLREWLLKGMVRDNARSK